MSTMIRRLFALFLVSCVSGAPALAAPWHPRAPAVSFRLDGLRNAEDPSLGALRAGSPAPRVALSTEERARLHEAEFFAPDLADLRGGVMDDHDLTVIAVVALAIIAVAIIL